MRHIATTPAGCAAVFDRCTYLDIVCSGTKCRPTRRICSRNIEWESVINLSKVATVRAGGTVRGVGLSVRQRGHSPAVGQRLQNHRLRFDAGSGSLRAQCAPPPAPGRDPGAQAWIWRWINWSDAQLPLSAFQVQYPAARHWELTFRTACLVGQAAALRSATPVQEGSHFLGHSDRAESLPSGIALLMSTA